MDYKKPLLPWSLEFKFVQLNAAVSINTTKKKKKANLPTCKRSSCFHLWEECVTEIESLQMTTVDLSNFIHFSFLLEKVVLLVLICNLIKPVSLIVKLFLLFFNVFFFKFHYHLIFQILQPISLSPGKTAQTLPLKPSLGWFCWLSSSKCSVRILSLNPGPILPLCPSEVPLLVRRCDATRIIISQSLLLFSFLTSVQTQDSTHFGVVSRLRFAS